MQTALLDELDLPDPTVIEAMLEGAAHYAYAVGRPRPAAEGEAAPIAGVDPRHPVRAVAHGDLVALVSDVSLAEYDLISLKQRLQDELWLEALARGHQRVMAALLERYTLLPLKLCTLYTSEQRLHEALAANLGSFTAALDRLEGASEWGVKLFCERAALSAWAAREQPQLRQLGASLAAASPGARYMLEKRMQRAAQQATDDLRRQFTEAIGAALADGPWAAQRGAVQPAHVHGRADEMVLNGAYLVGADALAAFRATLEGLAETYGPRGFGFVLTGPWPAYSFSQPSEQEAP